MLGALQKEGLMVSEAGEIQEISTVQEGTVEWNISAIYQQVLAAARGIAAQEEPIRGISFYSSHTDPFLFEKDGSLITPVIRAEEDPANPGLKKVLARIPPQELYQETGVQFSSTSMLCQFALESSRRLKRAHHVLSLPDGFNYFFSGVPRAEVSQAHQSQLYNVATKSWSERLLKASGVPARIMPPVVGSGTNLAPVRPEVAREAKLEDARVIVSCSHELAATLAALTLADNESWAFLRPAESTTLGTRLEAPFINDVSREMGYSNLVGYGDSVGFYKNWIGLRLVDECRRAWSQQDRGLDNEVLMHLATSATPFEAFIDPADPRFVSSADMPQEIQSFCRETGQEPPRKPGPTLRCVLESLALYYRKALMEMEYITGNNFRRLYVLADRSNVLLNHFLANALQIPVVMVPSSIAAFGNVAVQALSLKHIESLEEARHLLNHSLKVQTINPHATAWTEAYDRFLGLKATDSNQ
jgi:rhamnulokinase